MSPTSVWSLARTYLESCEAGDVWARFEDFVNERSLSNADVHAVKVAILRQRIFHAADAVESGERSEVS